VRLTQINLSGFKSFVDPTHVNVPGDLVGVVGPNGCGKSNIIDAVRWVLGESRASALRGDSMQDVIFNGSTLRKPVGRASVELIFDNAQGRAAGQWSQYAEISVKRVLTREGESSYFINNTHVRRRDIQDIFMGTGLGPRAYAIIEQGMISRIIEAKPEELRVFLEEAAGISKYKERRRETENRLADTRENLARVSDIRQELGAQIEKLERQAEVAQRYNELAAERARKQNLLWVARRLDAERDAERHQKDVGAAVNQLEGETARLREIEAALERCRDEHYQAGDSQSAAQVELAKANSEVTRLEAEIRFVAETRQRIESQSAQYKAQREAGERRRGELEEASTLWQGRHAEARSNNADTADRLAGESGRLPEAEAAASAARAALETERRRMTEAEQAARVEGTHVEHAQRTLQGLTARGERLAAERAQLQAPDNAAVTGIEAELVTLRDGAARQRELAARVDEVKQARVAARAEALAQVQAAQEALSTLSARLDALRRIQSQVDENAQIHDWIAAHQLGSLPRMWQKIRVADGWDVAIESLLRDRLHAIEIDEQRMQALLDAPPPAKVAAFAGNAHADLSHLAPIPGLRPVAERITVLDPGLRPVVIAWLKDCYEIDGTPSAATRRALPAGIILVNREGHQFSSAGIAFHAPDPADAGIFARQKEIESLDGEETRGRQVLEQAQAALRQAEDAAADVDAELSRVNAAGAALKQNIHERELELMRLVQLDARFREASDKLSRELDEIGAESAREANRRDAAQARLEAALALKAAAADSVRQALAASDQATQGLEQQRKLISALEREAQEAAFTERECQGKLQEIARSLQSAAEQLQSAERQLARLAEESQGLKDHGLREQLQAALEQRVQLEETLTQARARQEAASGALREADQAREESEERLQPLRDSINELRLKEQAARLALDQFSVQLREAGVDDTGMAALAEDLRQGHKTSQAELTRLAAAINELGAINMAALEELSTSQERKDFLDSQAEDLAAALETLEGAIRRIDRETREMLQNTFDTVNTHFSQMFPALFGGGEARLEMSGEEILDAGVQVIARPPGKKNSTIHLLSGGEKALTAIALVFSFFQLNPAPFCLLDEVDAPLDDANTVRFCDLVAKMSQQTQFLYISHNKLTMEMATHLVGVTMQERGVSRVVAVDIDEALKLREPMAA
jgi:chromosome segregation protein